MKLLYTLLCCCLGLLESMAQPVELFQAGTVKQRNFVEQVAVEWLEDYCVLTVTIEDQPMRFIFDTGASNIFSAKAAEKLGLTTVADSIGLIDINQLTSRIALVKSPPVFLGKTAFEGFYFGTSDAVFFEYLGIDGILGSNFFKDLVVQVDQQNSQLVFTDRLSKLGLKPKDGQKFFATPYQELPIISIYLDSCKKYRHGVLFDSGADGFYHIALNDWAVMQTLDIDWDILRTAQQSAQIGLNGISTDSSTRHIVRVPFMSLNEHCFPPVNANTFIDDKSSIGARLFCYGKVTLDYVRHRFFFQPYERTVKDACLEKEQRLGYGFSLNFVEDHVEIASIWKGSIAEKMQLSTGMVVTQLGDLTFPTEGMQADDMKVLVGYDYHGLPTLKLTVVENQTTGPVEVTYTLSRTAQEE